MPQPPTSPPLPVAARLQMADPRGWCDTCQNTGWVDCHCGGDLCICFWQGERPCPQCDGGPGYDDEDEELDDREDEDG